MVIERMEENAFSQAVKAHNPLIIAGAVNAYSALLAVRAGVKAVYLSGAGVANSSFGLPDLAMTTVDEVAEDASRITNAVEIPLLVDIDTGFGDTFGIARTAKKMAVAGVSAIHMEDQVSQKRCGHRPSKALVSTEEMCDRIKSFRDAQSGLYLIARTDALAGEGKEAAIERACKYTEAGADAIFAEAVVNVADYADFKESTGVPVLANMTEFGKTPYRSAQELGEAGAGMVLFPLSAFRAMAKAAEKVYGQLVSQGNVESMLGEMQTRTELYDVLDYHAYEDKLTALFDNDTATSVTQ